MSNFSWKSFVDRYNVDYITEGENVSRGKNININCPFCAEDTKYHLGLSLTSSKWGCWRSSSHRGKSPVRLVQALLRCTYKEACKIVGTKPKGMLDDGEFAYLVANIDSLLKGEEVEEEEKTLSLPKEVEPLDSSRYSLKFRNYLLGRGFKRKDIFRLISKYNLHYALTGDWSNRIILPIYLDGSLVTWTSRAVDKDAFLRYKTLPKEQELVNIKQTLYNYDDLLSGGDVLYITEGPFDAIKVDYFASEFNHRATCVFSKTLSDSQRDLFSSLRGKFDRFVILLDAAELGDALYFQSELSFLGDVVLGRLPPGVKDPGDLDFYQVKNLAETVLTESPPFL